jgi:CheY-like chemotaxis protein
VITRIVWAGIVLPSSQNLPVATKRSAGDLAERLVALRLPDCSLFPPWSLPGAGSKQVSAPFGFSSSVIPVTALRSTADEQALLRVLIVDDQLLYAEAISAVLGQQEGLKVVGIAGDGHDAIEQALALRPDIVLMDIDMPRLDGISATRQIRRRLPATRVLVMTALTGEHAEDAFGAGADGCIKKFSRAGEFLTAIERLAWGFGARTR